MSKFAGRLKECAKKVAQLPIRDWFFWLFLLVSFFNIRKVLFFQPISGTFNEYLGGYLYLADIVLIFWLLVHGISILNNKNRNKSIENQPAVSVQKKLPKSAPKRYIQYLFQLVKSDCFLMFHCIRKQITTPNSTFLWLLGAFVAWSFVSLFWVGDISTGLYRAIRLLELISLAIYIAYQIVPRGTIVNEIGLRNVPRGTFLGSIVGSKVELVVKFLRGALLGLLFVAPFDHYLWDIWFGQLVFWLLIGFLWGFQILLSQFNSTTDREEIVPRGTIINKTEAKYVPPAYRTGRRGTFLNKNGLLAGCFWLIMLIGTINSIVAIAQFLAQHSIGVRFLGESIIGTDISGVAKLVIGENIVLRAYGLMPHPNILGGLLLVTIVLTILGLKMAQDDYLGRLRSRNSKKLFHVEQLQKLVFHFGLFFRRLSASFFALFVRRRVLVESKESGEIVPRGTNNYKNESKNVSRGTFADNGCTQARIKTLISPNIYQSKYLVVIFGLLLIQIMALLLTFSKSAIGGLVVALAYIYASNKRTTGYFSGVMKKMFHMEHFPSQSFVFVGMVGFAILAGIFLGKYIWFSIEERLVGFFFSIETIFTHSLFGVGVGQFVPELWRTYPDLPVWQYQPVHNLFLLIWSELGVVGLVLFLMLLGKVLFMNRWGI